MFIQLVGIYEEKMRIVGWEEYNIGVCGKIWLYNRSSNLPILYGVLYFLQFLWSSVSEMRRKYGV